MVVEMDYYTGARSGGGFGDSWWQPAGSCSVYEAIASNGVGSLTIAVRREAVAQRTEPSSGQGTRCNSVFQNSATLAHMQATF